MINWIGKTGRTRALGKIGKHHGGFKDLQCPSQSRPLSSLFSKPPASEVLTCHLESNNCPPWTSYFVKYSSVRDDQWGRSHFNWPVKNGHNYHILRTGCYPYIKYHCTRRPHENLLVDDVFFRVIKVLNLGIPCLAYGLAFSLYPKKHTESVMTSQGRVNIYFHYKENKSAMY